MPLMNATGTKTADRPNAIAITAAVTSSIALYAASRGGNPCSIHRSTFSTTTIASSTTMPIASTSPNSDRLLKLNPTAFMIAHVPISDTGTASIGIRVARQLWRNTSTTSTTSTTASNSVLITSRNDSRTNTVVSYGIAYSSPCGHV